MALSTSALLDLLDALKGSDGMDVVRYAVQKILQELIVTGATLSRSSAVRSGWVRNKRRD